ncbi:MULTISPECIES: DUF6712 family protein [Sphingobacterium]|uniref:DUF6712 family protein n=1 Tax=Sphingobacterium populi TaxID=1812824 RepID=A0ABW5U7T1_9SPHI|nr:DUF6712 family protein [Sphingobacterium sp. CFCC 11742]
MRIVTQDDQIKEACSGVDVNFSLVGLQTFIDDAEFEILQLIGDNSLPELLADNFGARILRKAVVNLSLDGYASTGAVQISNSGIHVMKSGTMLPASDKKLITFRRDAKERGWKAFEQLLSYMESHKKSFPLWHSSIERLNYFDTLFRNSNELAQFSGITITAHLFQIIRPQLRFIQDDVLVKNFGSELISHLHSKLLQDSLQMVDRKLLRIFHRILGPLAVAEAIPYRAVQVTESGVFQASISTFGTNSDNIEGLTVVQQRILSSLLTKLTSEGESQIILAAKLIDANPQDWGSFNVAKPFNPEGFNDPESNVYLM